LDDFTKWTGWTKKRVASSSFHGFASTLVQSVRCVPLARGVIIINVILGF
jgi:hypothetical protein